MYIRQVFELLLDLFGVPGRNIEMPRIVGHGSERATGGTEKTREDREGFIRVFGRSRAAVYGSILSEEVECLCVGSILSEEMGELRAGLV